MDDFRDKVVVLTGAGSGIGAALARAFAAHGATVVACDIDGDSAERTARNLGHGAWGAAVDVADPDQMSRYADAVFERHQRVDLLFNNAGVFQGGLMWERSAADWTWVLGVNVLGITNAVRSFVPRMITAGRGHIINTASVAAFVAGPYASTYVASKCAAFALSEALALDLAAVGSTLDVSVVTPSTYSTSIAESARVRPPTLGCDDTTDGTAMAQMLAQRTGQAPPADDAVAPILDGIRQRKFVIPTNPIEAFLDHRHAALREGRLPTPLTVG